MTVQSVHNVMTTVQNVHNVMTTVQNVHNVMMTVQSVHNVMMTVQSVQNVPSVAAYTWLERQRGNLRYLAASRNNRSFDRNCSCTREEEVQESTSKSAPKPLLVCQSWASSMSLVSSELVGGRHGGCRRRRGVASSRPELAMGSSHTHTHSVQNVMMTVQSVHNVMMTIQSVHSYLELSACLPQRSSWSISFSDSFWLFHVLTTFCTYCQFSLFKSQLKTHLFSDSAILATWFLFFKRLCLCGWFPSTCVYGAL